MKKLMRCKDHFSFNCEQTTEKLFALCVCPLNRAHTKGHSNIMCAVYWCQAQFKCLVIIVNIGCLEQLKLLESVKGSVWPSSAEHDLQSPLKSLLASVIKYRNHLMKCFGTLCMNWCWLVLSINGARERDKALELLACLVAFCLVFECYL